MKHCMWPNSHGASYAQGRVKGEGHESSLWGSHPVMVTRRDSSSESPRKVLSAFLTAELCVHTSQHKTDRELGDII